MSRPSFLLVAFVLAAGTLTAQQQQPTFKSATRTVPIYATVTDKSGRLIPDLTKDDFEIFDNKVPQPVSLFLNDVQFIKAVVMLDMSGSMVNNIEFVKDAAEQFTLRLLPEDRARVGSFEDKIILSPTFTSNRDDLIHFIRNDLQYGNGTRLWDAVDMGMTALSGMEGRRVVVVFTDGQDEGSKIGHAEVLKRGETEEFMVYAIGFHSRYRGGNMGQMIESSPDSQLKGLAAETGGGYFELRKTDELNSTFTRVAQELHSQYVIGFSPKQLDGKLHTLEVRVKKPDMIARARKSYVASPEK